MATGDATKCESISNQELKQSCINTIAPADGTENVSANSSSQPASAQGSQQEISAEDRQHYENALATGQASECASIVNEDLKQSCYNIIP